MTRLVEPQQKRTLVLLGTLIFLLVALCFKERASIMRVYRSHAPPPQVRCNGDAPPWLSDVGRWAYRQDLPTLHLYLRTEAGVYDCTFGENAMADPPAEEWTSLPYASLTKVFTSTLALLQAQRGN